MDNELNISISDFLNTEYKDYSLYTIESRAIPSCIDSLKTVQRKILHVSSNIWKTGTEKFLKVFQLSGAVASDCYYHHGSASLESAIINMAQKFKNNLPLLEEDGQFGSLRSPEPGAARYIGTKLSKNFKLLFKDFELLEHKKEEGDIIEPHYFLPIIPMVLVNGTSGIAVGFASKILNRNPIDIITSCISFLNGKSINEVKPYSPYFKGDYIQDENNNKKWVLRGKVKVANTTTVHITELPPSMTYEKYEEILDGLVEDKAIVNYEDNCKDDINYVIKFTRENLAKLDESGLIKLLKLEESATENFTTLDEFGKLKIFESSKEIIEYFVNFRLGYYEKRKIFILAKLRDELKVLSNKGKFIRSILEEKIIVNKKSKEEINKQIEELTIDKMDDSYDYLLRMPIYSLTNEVFEIIKIDFKNKRDEIMALESKDVKEMYNEDLVLLKNNIYK